MLTEAQLIALAADIAADPILSAYPNNSDGNFAIAELYNLDATPAWYVWRSNIPIDEVRQAIVWTEYIDRSVGERETFLLMIANHALDASEVNVRQGIADIFSGPQAVGTRAALLALGKRTASRAEKLFSSGTGTEDNPATMEFEGNLSYRDVETARAT